MNSFDVFTETSDDDGDYDDYGDHVPDFFNLKLAMLHGTVHYHLLIDIAG